MEDLKKAYKTVMDDNFPDDLTVSFGDQKLIYRKKTWKIDEDGTLIEKGLRYGENPGQESAMYELINGNLVLGKCHFIESGKSLVSGIDENMMVQFGKHPGKINLTDMDNSLNILKYIEEHQREGESTAHEVLLVWGGREMRLAGKLARRPDSPAFFAP